MNTTFIINNVYHRPLPEYDPRNPPRTVPGRFDDDHTSPDAEEIIEKLRNARTEGEVREILWESFRDFFTHEFVPNNNPHDYKQETFDIWRYYCR